MSMLSTRTKARLGVRGARQAARRPALVARTLKIARPALRGAARGSARVERRRARHRAASMLESGRALGQTLVAVGREVGNEAAEAQSRRTRTMPRVAAGVALGAGAIYFLEPGSGAEHRRMAARLISRDGSGSGATAS